jgi:hypothetical protein
MRVLQAALVGLTALVTLLSATTLLLYSRLSRLRALAEQEPSAETGVGLSSEA